MKMSFPTFPIRRWPLIIVLAVILPLTACSSIRFGYNHADTFLIFRLDQYFDLEQSQKQLAKDRIGALLAWHRATQLQDYAALLDEIRAKLNGPVTPSEDRVSLFKTRSGRDWKRSANEPRRKSPNWL